VDYRRASVQGGTGSAAATERGSRCHGSLAWLDSNTTRPEFTPSSTLSLYICRVQKKNATNLHIIIQGNYKSILAYKCYLSPATGAIHA
jgi:hypothetical protein